MSEMFTARFRPFSKLPDLKIRDVSKERSDPSVA
jgi:hypothetical protein